MPAWSDPRLAAVPLLAVPAQPVPAGATECPDVAVLGELCDIGADVGGFLTNPVGTVAGGVGNAAVRAVTEWVIEGAVWFLGQVAAAVTESTKVEPTAAWFTRNYAVMAGIAAVIALPLLLSSLIGAVVNGDPGRFGRALTMTFAAGLGTFAAVTVTGLLLAITDNLSAHIASTMNADLKQALQGVGTGLTAAGSVQETAQPGTGAAVPLFAGFLAAIVIVIAAIGVWLELLLRQVAIYAALLFFPLALAGLIWPATSRWARRLTEILLSLIFAKLVIVALLSLGASGLASGGEGFSGVIAGAALLVLALCSPWVLIRIVGVAQVALAGTGLEGMRSRATHSAAHRTHQATDTMRKALGGSRGGAIGGGNGGLTVAGSSGGAAGGGTAAAGGAGAVAAAAVAAAQRVSQQAKRAVGTTDAAIDNPYEAPQGRGGSGGGRTPPARPPVRQVEARLAE